LKGTRKSKKIFKENGPWDEEFANVILEKIEEYEKNLNPGNQNEIFEKISKEMKEVKKEVGIIK